MAIEMKWRDSQGNQITDTLSIDPGSSAGNTTEIFESMINEGIDRTLTIEAQTPTGISEVLTINQEGKRQPFATSDGVRFRLSDGGVYGVLKSGN